MFFKNYIVFLCFIKQILIVLSVGKFPLDAKPQNVVEKCVIDILSSKTQHGSDVAVINTKFLSNDFLFQIHSTINAKLYIKDCNVSMKVSPGIYIIHVSNLFDFEILIDNLDRVWHRKPKALHIIILNNLNAQEFAKIFEILWQYHIINVIVVGEDVKEGATIYSYFPYEEGRCGRDYSNIVKLCDCKSAEHLDVIAKLNENNKHVLENCTLQVITHDYPPTVLSDSDSNDKYIIGIERYLLELLAEKNNIFLNYTFFPVSDDFGTVSDNGTVSGKLAKLHKVDVDLVFGGFSLDSRRSQFFDYVCSHLAFDDYIVTVIHKTDLVERWKIVYKIYDPIAWLVLVLVLIICVIFVLEYGNLKTSGFNICISSEVLNFFGSATQNMSLKLRKNMYKNCILVHWLWFMFLMTSFYQCRLTSYSTYRPYMLQPNKYWALKHYNLTPCISYDFAQYWKHSVQLPVINKNYIEFKGCETDELALNEIARTKTKYTQTMYFIYMWWILNNERKRNKIHLLNERFINNIYAMYFKRGFPLIQKFHFDMLLFNEYGIVEAIKSFHRISKEMTDSNAIGVFEVIELKLEDLTIPFGILIAGHTLAFFVFVFEILHTTRNSIQEPTK